MLRLLAVAALTSALPRNDGKSDEKLSHEAQTYYDPAAQTFALYTLLGVPTNATLTEIDRAFVKHKNDLERNRKNKKNVQIYGLIYKSLDENEDGLLSAEKVRVSWRRWVCDSMRRTIMFKSPSPSSGGGPVRTKTLYLVQKNTS